MTEDVAEGIRQHHAGLSVVASGMQSLVDLIEDSNERRNCIQAKLNRKVSRAIRANKNRKKTQIRRIDDSQDQSGPVKRRRSARLAAKGSQHKHKTNWQDDEQVDGLGPDSASSVRLVGAVPENVAVTRREVIKWLTADPTTNETTHYAIIMDPSDGKVAWARRYLEPCL